MKSNIALAISTKHDNYSINVICHSLVVKFHRVHFNPISHTRTHTNMYTVVNKTEK